MKLFSKRKALLLLTAFIMLFTSATVNVKADTTWPTGPDVIADTAIVMDADTGAILYSKEMDQTMYPASITKIMTCLLALENGNLSDEVTMTETGVAYVENGSSNAKTQVGEVFTLEQLLYGTMLKSANDMATQVGEYIGGTIDNFVDMMNQRAKELGCKNTHFNNACGMPDPDHYTTAYDMALICQAAVLREDFRTIVGTHSYTIPATNMTSTEREYTNHNPLLVDPTYAYPGIIGGKTGYTDSALNTLATMVSQNGMTLITVTFRNAQAGDAANDHINLYNWAYENFNKIEAENLEYVDSGGMATVPKETTASDLTVTETTDENGDVASVYTLNGTQVGTSYKSAETLAKKAEDEASASAAAESSAQAAEENNSAKTGNSASKTKINPLVIILVIILCLIVALMIWMIIAAHIRAVRRRRRRKRRQELKRQQMRMQNQRRNK